MLGTVPRVERMVPRDLCPAEGKPDKKKKKGSRKREWGDFQRKEESWEGWRWDWAAWELPLPLSSQGTPIFCPPYLSLLWPTGAPAGGLSPQQLPGAH